MNYEKLYKEALERAKSIHNEHRAQCADIMTKVFPELAESEDEKIKKSLIEYINGIKSWNYFLGISKEQMITWIEKQGEQKTAWSEDDEKKRTLLINILEVNHQNEYFKVNPANTLNNEAIRTEELILWLKSIKGKVLQQPKQIEEYDVPNTSIKDSEEVTSRMKYIDENLKPIAEFVMNYANWNLRKDEWNRPVATVPLFRVLDALVQNGKQYSEEYSVVDNNTEPKFEVGDWITNGEYTWKIVEVKPLDYILQSQDGNIVDDTISHVDDNFNLWTIKDAKDGDVVAIGDECFLFKEKKENTLPTVYISHCFSNSTGAFRITNGRDCGEFLSIENGVNVCPATKEQRDLLFQKMKEAGYEWDGNTKQLIKNK